MTTTEIHPAEDHRPSFLSRHPWLMVAMAFGLLIGAWSALITIAVKHAPQALEAPAKP